MRLPRVRLLRRSGPLASLELCFTAAEALESAPYGTVQSSNRRPSIRENSRVLCVTRIASSA